MAHQPRQYSSTIGVPPELLQQPRDKHSTIPIKQDNTREDKSSKVKLGLEKLNLRTYEPDFNQLYKSMFGRDANIDNYTKQLVPTPATSNSTAFGSKQTGTSNTK